jgi:alanine dehydrogenase
MFSVLDEDYAAAGATVVADAIGAADVVLTVGPPDAERARALRPGTLLIGLLAPSSSLDLVRVLGERLVAPAVDCSGQAQQLGNVGERAAAMTSCSRRLARAGSGHDSRDAGSRGLPSGRDRVPAGGMLRAVDGPPRSRRPPAAGRRPAHLVPGRSTRPLVAVWTSTGRGWR